MEKTTTLFLMNNDTPSEPIPIRERKALAGARHARNQKKHGASANLSLLMHPKQ